MKDIAKSLTSKFNLYDHIGYLLVGSIGLLLLSMDLRVLYITNLLPTFSLQNGLVWLVAAYFVGHIVQAIANLIIKEDKGHFSESDKVILKDAKDYFGYEQLTDGEAFQYCYMLACAKDITGHVTAFNAYYSLYRGWLILFSIEAIFFVVYLFLNWFSWLLVLPFLGSIGIALLMNNRRKRFWKYLGAKTLQTFVVLRKLGE